jgi:hypothetical protein
MTFYIIIAALAFVLSVHYWPGRTGSKEGRRPLTEEEIAQLFPCVYYPGQASAPPVVELLAEYSDTIVLARIATFDFGGFDKPDITWTAVLLTCRSLKGQGEDVYRLPIRSPERNFGPKAVGRLFIVFIRESDDGLIWALEPWLPENEDIACGT